MTEEERQKLRNEFAGMAMQAYTSTIETIQRYDLLARKTGVTTERLIAKGAYEMADAMLAEMESISKEKISDIAKPSKII